MNTSISKVNNKLSTNVIKQQLGKTYHSGNLHFTDSTKLLDVYENYFVCSYYKHPNLITLVDSISLEVIETFDLGGLEVNVCIVDKKHENFIIDAKEKDEPAGSLYIYNIKSKSFTHERLTKNIQLSSFKHIDNQNKYAYYTSSRYGKNERHHLYRVDTESYENKLIYNSSENYISSFCMTFDEKYIHLFLSDNTIKTIDTHTLKVMPKKANSRYSRSYYSAVHTYPSPSQNSVVVRSAYNTLIIYDFDKGIISDEIDFRRFNHYDYINKPLRGNYKQEYSVSKAYLNEKGDCISLLYRDTSYTTVYLDIIDIKNFKLIHRQISTDYHTISNASKKYLADNNFLAETIDDIKIQYRYDVISINSQRTSSLRLSYCNKTKKMAVGGVVPTFLAVLDSFDLSTCTEGKTIYGNEYIIGEVSLENNILSVGGSTIGDYNVHNIWDIDKGTLLKKTKLYKNSSTLHHAIPTVYNERYNIYFSKEKIGELIIKDKQNNYLGKADATTNVNVFTYFTDNKDVFYVSYNRNIYNRYDIKLIDENGFLSPERVTINDGSEKGYYPMNETHDGRYLIASEPGQIIDTKTNTVFRKLHKMPDDVHRAFMDDSFDFIIAKTYEDIIYILDGYDGRILAEINFLINGRVVFQAVPEKSSVPGWFYTNCPESLNVYARYPDGSKQVLNPGDSQRDKHIKMYMRRDILKALLFDREKYHRITGSIKKYTELQDTAGQLENSTLLLNNTINQGG